MEEIEHVKPSDEDGSSKCDKVTIEMISPAQDVGKKKKQSSSQWPQDCLIILTKNYDTI